MFCRKRCSSANLANFTGKHLSWSIKKKLQHRRFSVKFANFLRTPILKNIFERVIVHIELPADSPHKKRIVPLKISSKNQPNTQLLAKHCVKSVHILSFSVSYFLTYGHFSHSETSVVSSRD